MGGFAWWRENGKFFQELIRKILVDIPEELLYIISNFNKR